MLTWIRWCTWFCIEIVNFLELFRIPVYGDHAITAYFTYLKNCKSLMSAYKLYKLVAYMRKSQFSAPKNESYACKLVQTIQHIGANHILVHITRILQHIPYIFSVYFMSILPAYVAKNPAMNMYPVNVCTLSKLCIRFRMQCNANNAPSFRY